MSHSLARIWIHGVFSTKYRKPIIDKKFEAELFNHISQNLMVKYSCRTKAINGSSDHIHILYLHNPYYAIADVFHSLKGESSHWINENKFLDEKFLWQIGYGAFSVSESHIEKVVKYIDNQKEHHKKQSFDEEYVELQNISKLLYGVS